MNPPETLWYMHFSLLTNTTIIRGISVITLTYCVSTDYLNTLPMSTTYCVTALCDICTHRKHIRVRIKTL